MLNAEALQLLVDLVNAGNSQRLAKISGTTEDNVLTSLIELNFAAPGNWVMIGITHAEPTEQAIKLIEKLSPQLDAASRLQDSIVS